MNFWTAVATLALIMDPLGNVPLFAAVLQRFSDRERLRIVIRELLIALTILMLFLHAGHYLLAFLGLKPATLRIAGGVILFLIALRMVFPSREAKLEAGEDEEPFVVPLAVPLVAGPAAIAVLMLLANSEPDRIGQWTLALLISWCLCAVVLLSSSFLIAKLSRRLLRAAERLMGMILIMLGAQMLLDGVADYLQLDER